MSLHTKCVTTHTHTLRVCVCVWGGAGGKEVEERGAIRNAGGEKNEERKKERAEEWKHCK